MSLIKDGGFALVRVPLAAVEDDHYDNAPVVATTDMTFPVEDGEARVVGYAEWSGKEYMTIIVTKADGSGEYSSVRLASLVRRHLGIA